MRAILQLAEWMPAGLIFDPENPKNVVMRLFFSIKTRKWAYRAYTGASERNVTKEHCLNQAQALIGDTNYVGATRYVPRLNWSAKDKQAPVYDD